MKIDKPKVSLRVYNRQIYADNFQLQNLASSCPFEE